eukprot:113748-Pyramimonas_sp.AAC.1
MGVELQRGTKRRAQVQQGPEDGPRRPQESAGAHGKSPIRPKAAPRGNQNGASETTAHMLQAENPRGHKKPRVETATRTRCPGTEWRGAREEIAAQSPQ